MASLPSTFKPLVVDERYPRLLLELEGRQGRGKSHFALTAPKPLLYCNFDKSSEEDVFHKFKGELIHSVNYWPKTISKEEGERVWAQFDADYHEALIHPDVRTIVVDTTTELRNIGLARRWGKIHQLGTGDNAKYMYAPIHNDIRQLVNDAYASKKNLIFVHKQKKEYKHDTWTGGWELQGFSEMPFLVQVGGVMNVENTNQGFDFTCTLNKCSIDMALTGMELRTTADRSIDMCNFPTLASMVFPNTELGDWA